LNDLAAELAQTVDLYASFGAFGQADKPEFLCKNYSYGTFSDPGHTD
jgi:hypothetical protein